MTSNKTLSDSNNFIVSVNDNDEIFELYEKTTDGGYIFKSKNTGVLHPFIAIPPFHLIYITNNKTKYIFKSEL
jgi:hypothetical protein